jgi:hypothetical protein
MESSKEKGLDAITSQLLEKVNSNRFQKYMIAHQGLSHFSAVVERQ